MWSICARSCLVTNRAALHWCRDQDLQEPHEVGAAAIHNAMEKPVSEQFAEVNGEWQSDSKKRQYAWESEQTTGLNLLLIIGTNICAVKIPIAPIGENPYSEYCRGQDKNPSMNLG